MSAAKFALATNPSFKRVLGVVKRRFRDVGEEGILRPYSGTPCGLPRGATTISYNAAGQLTGYTYPDGTVVGRSYTDRGQLYQLTHASSTIDTRTYDDGGRMTGSSYGNGVSESRSYNTNAKNTLASISFTGASFRSVSYGWDDIKNNTSKSITGTMSGYGFTVGTSGYDTEDRLVNWERSDSNLDQSWDLSLVGDWDSITENSATQSRTHGPTHELLSAGGQSLSHDTKGNMTLIPAVLRDGTKPLSHCQRRR